MEISRDLLHELPKVELHYHLDGSLRIPTIIDLAQRDKVKLPYTDEIQLKNILSAEKKRGTLEDYIKRFDITLSIMQTPESLTRTAYELAEDAASENVRYIEIRYSS